MKVTERASILDVVSMTTHRDTVFMLPTLAHAVDVGLWKILGTAFAEQHGEEWLNSLRTSIAVKRFHTVCFLWVPFARERTLPMDFEQNRQRFAPDYVTPYTARDVRAWMI